MVFYGRSLILVNKKRKKGRRKERRREEGEVLTMI